MMSRRKRLPSLSSSRQIMTAWKVSGLSHRPAIMALRPAPVVALHPPWPHPPSMIARTLLLSLATACALACAAPRSLAAAARDRDAEATRLLQHAERLLAMQTIEQRRSAIADLERATDLAPARPDVQITLARAYYKAGFLKQAKIRYERAVALAPENSQARFGLGQAWERDWLKYLERSSLDLAVEHFAAAGRPDSSKVQAWVMLSPLEVEGGERPGARAAAEHALLVDHSRAESMLAAASARWRQGDVEGGDSLFHAALGRLRRRDRERHRLNPRH